MSEPQPSKPYSRKLFDTPTLVGIGALVLGILVLIAAPVVHLIGILLFVGGVAFLAWYCTRDIVRWVQERRAR
ncbi:MAG TPA: hypothetical protein VH084_17525 [Mycobacterium sp.]|nr:hypothetical protein [Mycobacterium sp.]